MTTANPGFVPPVLCPEELLEAEFFEELEVVDCPEEVELCELPEGVFCAAEEAGGLLCVELGELWVEVVLGVELGELLSALHPTLVINGNASRWAQGMFLKNEKVWGAFTILLLYPGCTVVMPP